MDAKVSLGLDPTRFLLSRAWVVSLAAWRDKGASLEAGGQPRGIEKGKPRGGAQPVPIVTAHSSHWLQKSNVQKFRLDVHENVVPTSIDHP